MAGKRKILYRPPAPPGQSTDGRPAEGQKSLLYKPLPEQPRSAPSDLNTPLSAANAAKRAERWARNEAARAPEKRLLARTDLDVRGRRIYSQQWLRMMDQAMRLWCEFLQTTLGRTDGPDYFKPDGPFPDRLLLHQFCFWLGDTAVGNMASSSHEPSTVTTTNRLTVTALGDYATRLVSAIKYYNRPPPTAMLSELLLWIKSDLAAELDLNREVKPKPIAYTADVSVIIGAIWDFESLSVMKSIYAMFNTSLVLNFMVDGASRIGEYVPGSSDSQKKGRFLKWKDIEFWMHPTADGADSVTISAIILCKWMKGHESNPGEFKKYVVRLLPPHFAFQDSCRLLVTLALHHGCFRDFKTWPELASTQPSEWGHRILINPSVQEDPVFVPLAPRGKQIGTTDLLAGDDDSKQPWKYHCLNDIMKQLSRLAGFSHKVGTHQLRHGDAFLLNQVCRHREDASRIMGHKGSESFTTYLSKTSTTDLQALARGLPAIDLTVFSGLTLGRCTNAPVTLPPEELDAIDTHPEYLSALAAVESHMTIVVEEFQSLKDLRHMAKSGSDRAADLLKEYERLMMSKTSSWARLAEIRFRAYRETAVKELTAAKPTIADASSSSSDEAPSDLPESGPLILDDHAAYDLAGMDDDKEIGDADIIRETVGSLTPTVAVKLLMAADEGAIDTPSDAGEHLNPLWRRHRVFRDALASQVGRVGRKGTNLSSFSPDYTNLKDIYQRLSTEGVSSDEVMSGLLSLLANEVHFKDLPHHWLNHEGDLSCCLVCGEKLEIDTAYTHVRACLRTQAEATASTMWDQYLETLPTQCNWVTTVKGKSCKVDISSDTPANRQAHFFKHKSTYPKCYWDGCKESFNDIDEQNRHAWEHHGIILAISPASLHFWCPFCKVEIFENIASAERQQHFQGHITEALQMVRDYGYGGITMGQDRTAIRVQDFSPGFCIFCIHDHNRSWEDRLHAVTHHEISRHLHTHFRFFNEEQMLPCPGVAAGTCAYPEEMDLPSLWEHIEKVHYCRDFGSTNGPGKTGRVRKRKREAKAQQEEQSDDDEDEEGSSQPTKKKKTGKGITNSHWKYNRGAKNQDDDNHDDDEYVPSVRPAKKNAKANDPGDQALQAIDPSLRSVGGSVGRHRGKEQSGSSVRPAKEKSKANEPSGQALQMIDPNLRSIGGSDGKRRGKEKL